LFHSPTLFDFTTLATFPLYILSLIIPFWLSNTNLSAHEVETLRGVRIHVQIFRFQRLHQHYQKEKNQKVSRIIAYHFAHLCQFFHQVCQTSNNASLILWHTHEPIGYVVFVLNLSSNLAWTLLHDETPFHINYVSGETPIHINYASGII
jgi:hypothetical protein